MSYQLVKSSDLVDLSPTVALERGNYRMRAPGLRPRSLFQQQQEAPIRIATRRSDQHSINRNISLVLFLLVLAVFTSFGSAYYLFSKRWEPAPHKFIDLKLNTTLKVNVSMFDNQLYKRTKDEKFLSYLPHSGFHNQRIAFENALILAYALDRTLIVPPIRLGNKAIRYVEHDKLARHLELTSKNGLQHCTRLPAGLSFPMECLDYFESALIPWNWLIDLSAISTAQPMVFSPQSSQLWIYETLGIQPDDTRTLRDESPYQFRFLDSDKDASPPTHRYSEDIYFSDLATSQETLLQIGTLFGTSRLRLKDDECINYRRFVRKNVVVANQDLTNAASSIALALGDNFISVHLRAGDGHFKREVSKTIRTAWKTILRDVMGFSNADSCDLSSEQDILNCLATSPCTESCMRPPDPLKIAISDLRCRRPHSSSIFSGLNTPLYVATDLGHPATHPDLELFRQTFPCLFFLSDFPQHMQLLESLRSPYDDVDLFPFLHPLIDGMVAAKASRFVGTEGSTFSTFVMDMWRTLQEVPGSR